MVHRRPLTCATRLAPDRALVYVQPKLTLNVRTRRAPKPNWQHLMWSRFRAIRFVSTRYGPDVGQHRFSPTPDVLSGSWSRSDSAWRRSARWCCCTRKYSAVSRWFFSCHPLDWSISEIRCPVAGCWLLPLCSYLAGTPRREATDAREHGSSVGAKLNSST